MATGRVPTTANSPLTAKGDLFGYSTTQARVAVGNDGETLVADSSTSTGLRYTAGTVQANPVLNSAFQVWQRGTTGTANSFSAGSGYNADRWQNYYAGSLTTSRQSTNDTTNLPFIQYCARVQRNSGQTNTGGLSFGQTIESINSIPFVGKTVTFSYYARAGANYSATSNALGINFYAGTGTDGNVFFGFTGSSTLLSTTSTLTTTWQRFTHTFAIGTSFAQIGFVFTETPTGTAGTNDYFEITGAQIDIGSVALPFRTYAGTIQGELAACQRYFQQISNTNGDGFCLGQAFSTTQVRFIYPYSEMRTSPSFSVSTASDFALTNASATYSTCSSLTLSGSTTKQAAFTGVVASGLVAGNASFIRGNSGSGSYLQLSAEL